MTINSCSNSQSIVQLSQIITKKPTLKEIKSILSEDWQNRWYQDICFPSSPVLSQTITTNQRTFLRATFPLPLKSNNNKKKTIFHCQHSIPPIPTKKTSWWGSWVQPANQEPSTKLQTKGENSPHHTPRTTFPLTRLKESRKTPNLTWKSPTLKSTLVPENKNKLWNSSTSNNGSTKTSNPKFLIESKNNKKIDSKTPNSPTSSPNTNKPNPSCKTTNFMLTNKFTNKSEINWESGKKRKNSTKLSQTIKLSTTGSNSSKKKKNSLKKRKNPFSPNNSKMPINGKNSMI